MSRGWTAAAAIAANLHASRLPPDRGLALLDVDVFAIYDSNTHVRMERRERVLAELKTWCADLGVPLLDEAVCPLSGELGSTRVLVFKGGEREMELAGAKWRELVALDVLAAVTVPEKRPALTILRGGRGA